jgi:cupin 2 domain-containing protein
VNIYENLNIPEVLENFESLYEKNGVLIERIVSSSKPEIKVYNQPYDEWLVVIDGEATLRVGQQIVNLKIGDTFLIEKNSVHQVLATQKGTIWLCVHMKNTLNCACTSAIETEEAHSSL